MTHPFMYSLTSEVRSMAALFLSIICAKDAISTLNTVNNMNIHLILRPLKKV